MSINAICYAAHIDWTSVHRPVETEIEHMLGRARRLNRLNGVTGAILLYRDHLVQWLEGERGGLVDSRDCASRDARLSGLFTLCEGPVSERLFPHCWLYFADYRLDDAVPGGLLGRLANAPVPVDLPEMAGAMAEVARVLEPARFTHAAMLV
ncbi:BLUF domain-containing protein [Stappia sp.]|jgi:hypothetical protein|uniref:BLUF domain-containing protein n=1 Tax=Stappia sp. TaxID=1870903 RepID=UPI003D119D71